MEVGNTSNREALEPEDMCQTVETVRPQTVRQQKGVQDAKYKMMYLSSK